MRRSSVATRSLRMVQHRQPLDSSKKSSEPLPPSPFFRMGVVEERIGEEQGAAAARMAGFVDVLRQDVRLQSVYDPRGYVERLEREGKI